MTLGQGLDLRPPGIIASQHSSGGLKKHCSSEIMQSQTNITLRLSSYSEEREEREESQNISPRLGLGGRKGGGRDLWALITGRQTQLISILRYHWYPSHWLSSLADQYIMGFCFPARRVSACWSTTTTSPPPSSEVILEQLGSMTDPPSPDKTTQSVSQSVRREISNCEQFLQIAFFFTF